VPLPNDPELVLLLAVLLDVGDFDPRDSDVGSAASLAAD